MPGTTLPRTVRISVLALDCALWPLAGFAALDWDVRPLVLTLALASIGTVALGFLYLAAKIDEIASQQRERTHERQLALIRAIELMSCGPVTGPQEKLETTELRVVS